MKTINDLESSKSLKRNKKEVIFKKVNVYNLIILDESGSMESIKTNIISGFNELISSVKNIEKMFTEQKHFVSFVTFNSSGIRTILDGEPAKNASKINENLYNPDSMTPLYDAIGISVKNLSNKLNKIKNYKVIVTILTDGLENASNEYTKESIKQIIEILKEVGWEFRYIGTEHDVNESAGMISIDNVLSFKKDRESIKNMFVAEAESNILYCREMREK